MSQYKFSENKEHNAEVIREMLSYLKTTFHVMHLCDNTYLIDAEAIKEFADKVENGDII
jgi:hypothetical protein